MAAFQIDLKHLQGRAVERDLSPSPETLEKLFSGLGDDLRLHNPQNFQAHIRAQMNDATVHVVGEARAEFLYTCGRCRTKRPLEVDADIDFVLMSEADWSSAYAGKEEISLSADDLDVSFYSGDIIDIGELVREALVLELPVYPQCPPELSEECDTRFNERVGTETLEKLEDNKIDPRWDALKNLKISESGEIQKIDSDKDKN